MKHNRNFLAFALLVVGTMPTFSQVSNDNEDEVYKIDSRVSKNDFVPGQVLVKFKDGNRVNVSRTRGHFSSVNNNAVNSVLKEFGAETMDKLLPNAKPIQTKKKTRAFNGKEVEEKDLSLLYTVKINSLRKDSTMMLVDKLQEIDAIEYAEPNYKIYMMGQVPMAIPESPSIQVVTSNNYTTRTTDNVICANPEQNPLYAQQWGITHLKINELWNKPIINSKRPVIAILDTGVDITHPDLVDNIWTKPGTEDEHGYDFINETYNIRDYNSHGTHVAGIAAASNNETGIIGANPQALIMPITVMQSDGTGDIQVLIKGIQYAMDNGADVINMSLGTYAQSQALREILMTAYHNAVLVASAGNDALPLRECTNAPTTMYPAGYNFVLGIQASSQSGGLAGFSNLDCNGPTYSEYNLDDAENYELMAPGTNIVSCIPYGKYKSLNGTSMSSPLVAGAISALKMVKEYNSPEIMWADLIHSDCDFLATYNINERKPDIEVMTLVWNDTEDGGNGDGHYDAGETVRFYPIVRTVWGEADNIKFHLDYANEYDDHSLVEIIQNDVDFGWNLSAYAYETSKNPIIFKVADNCPDNRHIQLRLTVSCEGAINPTINQDFTLVVDNVIKLHGLQNEDLTLSPNHKYLVSGDYAILEGVTLTIEPGTRLMFREGVTFDLFGTLNAVGEPGNMITFERHVGDGGPYNINLHDNSLKYCIIDGAVDYSFPTGYARVLLGEQSVLEDCIVRNSNIGEEKNVPARIRRCNITSVPSGTANLYHFSNNCINCNFVNNEYDDSRISWERLHQSNFFDNIITENNKDDNFYNDYIMLVFKSGTPAVQTNDNPAYLGTSREDLVRPHVLDMNHGDGVGNGYGVVDLSNMLTEPVHEAHGIVWKVLVDGIDPQDQYEIMPPIGVGKHKFEVYFNRPMNKAVIPNVAFGVRSPFNQNAIDEDGAWNDEGTIYTAYKTITGKTQSDGLNRINVWGAEDDEFFECPYENWRFRIHIQSAGSLATGFAASAGMGKVNLTWDNTNNDFDDAMGFNIYRYTIDQEGKADTICINKEIVDIETTVFTDYDVIPGTTYYYLYRVLSTGLKEYDVSNVVSATPLTATRGDANGSGDVDVSDVITTVNYAAGMDPKPFIFEAADMNTDENIDILDVIGIIQGILNPSLLTASATEATATFTIEDGTLYVESPVALAGVQIQLATRTGQEITVASDLDGFEHTSTWLSNNDYRFLAYNMNGKTLSVGKHALLYIGDSEINSICLGDVKGNRVMAVGGNGDTTGIDRMGKDVMNVKGVYNLKGQKITDSEKQMKDLPKGVYIIDGIKVVK